MRKSKLALPSFIPALLSFLLALGTATVFSACGMKEDGTWMHCHDAQNRIVLVSSIMILPLILQAILDHRALRIVLNVAVFVCAICLFLIPGQLMPMCMMHTMRCYTVMQPFVRIMSVVIAGSCLVNLILLFRKKRT